MSSKGRINREIQGNYGIGNGYGWVATKNVWSRDTTEAEIRDELAEREDGCTEVDCEYGRVDVVTDEYVIEVKKMHKWKHALGQILCYHESFPDLKPRLHFFGTGMNPTNWRLAEKVCAKHGIAVSYHKATPI